MGSSHSSRRRQNHHHAEQQHHHHHHHQQQQQQQQAIYPAPPRWGNAEVGPCPHMSPYFSQHLSPPVYHQQGYYVPPGHFIAPPPQGFIQQPSRSSPAPPVAVPALPPPPPAVVPEYQKASTVRNDVNLNKSTLRLERDESNPDHHLVVFSFDATEAGSISVFFLAREAADGSVACISRMLPEPKRLRFKSGLGQKFRQDSGLDFGMIDEEDLSKVGPDNLYPLVIRIETVSKDPAATEQEAEEDPPPGGALTKWIHCQQTYAIIVKKDSGEFDVKVVKQIIWVDAVRYELQEIFGIASGNGAENSSEDSGKDCVICLSEPKDTTVLPCRHMCMCSDCANVLRYQSNLCPICRCPIEELIQINVPAADTD